MGDLALSACERRSWKIVRALLRDVMCGVYLHDRDCGTGGIAEINGKNALTSNNITREQQLQMIYKNAQLMTLSVFTLAANCIFVEFRTRARRNGATATSNLKRA